MKTKVALALVLLCCLLSCKTTPTPQTEPPHAESTPFDANEPPVPQKIERTLAEAMDEEEASVAVTGVDVEELSVTIRATHPGKIIIPGGTVFTSAGPNTQNMMAAHDVVVVFSGDPAQPFLTPQSQTKAVEVYCVNRFLDAPTSSTDFTVSSGGDDLDPVRRLAACLERDSTAPHYAKQLAIWMSSDNFVKMSVAEVRAKMRQHAEDLLNNPNSQGWEKIREKSHLTPEQVQAIIDDPPQLEKVRSSAYQEVDQEISDYRSIAGPLLEKCGISISTSKFFQGPT